MIDRLFIKPAPGLSVRDPEAPDRAPIPAHGKGVLRSTFWVRRLADGDVVETTEAAIAAATKKTAAAEKKDENQ